MPLAFGKLHGLRLRLFDHPLNRLKMVVATEFSHILMSRPRYDEQLFRFGSCLVQCLTHVGGNDAIVRSVGKEDGHGQGTHFTQGVKLLM